MTKREAYQAVVEGNVTEEVIEKFSELIEMENAANTKKREKAAEKRAEKLQAEKVLEEGILEFLSDEPKTASDICEAIEDIKTPQKATVIAKRLVESGSVKVEKIKGKNGKVNGYTLV